LKSAFEKIRSHPKLSNLPLSIAVWNIKHSHKTPFEEETAERFGESLQTYITGAFNFSHEVVKMIVSQSPEPESGKPLQKRGTLIFTGTLGALRTNSGYGAYGAGRSGVRMLAQSLAREMSPRGIHVVHTIANGGIIDETEEKGGEEWEKTQRGERMKAESVGKTYLWLASQGVDLWTHELDMRPAAEKF
jgi:NAD(P)-dependent dehydrogenase (short-subunit alcohol dehydrogenase family)